MTAHNLAWKLALVIKKQAADPERLLDSYTEERMPIIRETVNMTSRLVALMKRAGAWYSGFFAFLLSTAIGYKSVQRALLPNVLQA